MVQITQKLLTSRYSRPFTKMHSVRGVVVHYTANPNANPDSHYTFFQYNNRRYAGAHYFVKRDYVVRMIPEDETTYHANETGRSNVAAFNGYRSSDGYQGNANSCTIGIEMELEPDGSIHPETINTTIRLAADVMRRYSLPMSRLVRHYDITGKICPLQFVRDNGAYQAFRNGVSQILSGNSAAPAAKKATEKVSQTKRPVNNLSIVDFMNAHGMDSSFNNRAELARQYGISNYTGTATQNQRLLQAIRNNSSASGASTTADNGWKTNRHGTQYLATKGTFTVGSKPITVRDKSPFLSAPQGRTPAKPGNKIKYHELVRQDGHIWVGYYTGSGMLRYCPIRTWNPSTGAVGPAWGTFS